MATELSRHFNGENWTVMLTDSSLMVVFGRELTFEAKRTTEGSWVEVVYPGTVEEDDLDSWKTCYELVHEKVLDMLCSSSGLTTRDFYSSLEAAFSPEAHFDGSVYTCFACRPKASDSVLVFGDNPRCGDCNYSIIGLPEQPD